MKRRVIARELCENGKVFVNGQTAKSSKNVMPGDVITVTYSTRTIELEVLIIPSFLKQTEREKLYRLRSL